MATALQISRTDAACEDQRPPPDLNRSNQFVKSKIQICFSLPTSLFSKRCLHSSERLPRVVVTVVPRQWPLRFVVRAPLQFSKRPSIATSELTHRQIPR